MTAHRQASTLRMGVPSDDEQAELTHRSGGEESGQGRGQDQEDSDRRQQVVQVHEHVNDSVDPIDQRLGDTCDAYAGKQAA